MRYFLQWFGVFWLILTLPVVGLVLTQSAPNVSLWAIVVLGLVAVIPGLWGLHRSKSYPVRDEWSDYERKHPSVINGSIELYKRLKEEYPGGGICRAVLQWSLGKPPRSAANQ
jgi:hypothetical protein